RNGFFLFELEAGSDLDAKFSHFWKQVDQATAMILDRLLLRLEMDNIRSIWERTFESLTSPLVILDKEGKIKKMNKAFLQIQSYDLMLFLIDHHKENVSSLEWKTHHQNFQLLAFPILFEHAGIDSTLYYFQDQNELQENYSKMVQTEKMAAIGLLAGNRAHELNNPFAGLKSMTQLLLSESEFSPYAEDLTEILNGVNRCLNTIQNLQNYTTEDGDSRQTLAVKDVIENTIPLLKSVLRQFYVSINYDSNPGVFVNSHLLQQVVFNLVHNSSQAMTDGGKLEIHISEDDEDAIIAITDNGKGISTSDMPFVFDPFFTTKKVGDGTGLGLSICKKIIDSYSGSISVESEVGKSTTFTIRLPKTKGVA
ncbi:MAG: GHKL domain-containing protein, partial [Bdellovibrionales bacterium]|nr:GHKL domain-containing protein [Bdellovibrionales bacterium]